LVDAKVLYQNELRERRNRSAILGIVSFTICMMLLFLNLFWVGAIIFLPLMALFLGVSIAFDSVIEDLKTKGA